MKRMPIIRSLVACLVSIGLVLTPVVTANTMAATPPGLTVTVECEVVAVEGRKVTFKARAHDGVDLISEGTHERVVIDAARFNARLVAKRPR